MCLTPLYVQYKTICPAYQTVVETLVCGKPWDTTNREVKSSAFTTLFGQAENSAKLYMALTGEEAVSPEETEFTTLQGVLLMVRKNGLAFVAALADCRRDGMLVDFLREHGMEAVA